MFYVDSSHTHRSQLILTHAIFCIKVIRRSLPHTQAHTCARAHMVSLSFIYSFYLIKYTIKVSQMFHTFDSFGLSADGGVKSIVLINGCYPPVHGDIE